MQRQEIEDLEKTVLGACMLESHAPMIAYQWIGSKESFWLQQEASITWWAIEELVKASQPIDLRTVNAKCRSHKEYAKLAKTMSFAYWLSECTNMVASAANLHHHAALLVEGWIRRSVKIATSVLANEVQDDNSDVFDLIAQTENTITKIMRQITPEQFKDFHKVLTDSVMEVIKASENDSPIGISSGWHDLDNVLGSFMPGSLNVIAARPGMGKTAFVLGLAQNIARQKKQVLFFSLEMSAHELACRILASETGIPNNYILRNPKKLSPDQKQKLADQTASANKLPISIFDEGHVTISSIRANCRKAKETTGVDFIVIDYLQIMSPESEAQRKDTNKFYEELTRDIKILAKTLKVPVVLLSQLNRSVDSRKDNKPNLSDLRGSGGIEQNADTVFFLFRPEYYNEGEKTGQPEQAFVFVEKNRNGSVGEVEMTFIPMLTKFTSRDSQSYIEPQPRFNITIQPQF